MYSIALQMEVYFLLSNYIYFCVSSLTQKTLFGGLLLIVKCASQLLTFWDIFKGDYNLLFGILYLEREDLATC